MLAPLLLIGVLLSAGLLLYLPFWIWFRYRRHHGKSMGRTTNFTSTGGVFLTAQLALLLGGFGAGVLAPESWLGSFTAGYAGILRWYVCVVVASGSLERVLRRAGVVLQRHASSAEQGRSARQPGRLDLLNRRWRLGTIAGVPFFVQGSLPLGGLLVAALANADAAATIGYSLAFVALIAIHELGHVAAARALGLKVYSIHVSGLGGSCLTQVPRGVRDTLILFSGGLAAQLVLLLATLATVMIAGVPQSAVGRSLLMTFTVVNLLIAVINLVPGRISDELSTDGGVLWDLFLHARFGRPHPLASQHAASPVFPRDARLLTMDGMAPPGFAVGVELLNDDATPMEFVVTMLEKHLQLSPELALEATMRIHVQGGLLLPLPDRARAVEAADAVTRDAHALGHLFTCRVAETTPDPHTVSREGLDCTFEPRGG
jgi:ATP-dependent Clp protease adapter protein ClpS